MNATVGRRNGIRPASLSAQPRVVNPRRLIAVEEVGHHMIHGVVGLGTRRPGGARHSGVETSRNDWRSPASRCCSGRWSSECHSTYSASRQLTHGPTSTQRANPTSATPVATTSSVSSDGVPTNFLFCPNSTRCSSGAPLVDKPTGFGGDFGVFGCHAEETAVGRGFKDVESAATLARRRARCIRTVFDRKRSRVPVVSSVGGNPVRSAKSGERYGCAKSCPAPYSSFTTSAVRAPYRYRGWC